MMGRLNGQWGWQSRGNRWWHFGCGGRRSGGGRRAGAVGDVWLQGIVCRPRRNGWRWRC